MKSKLNIQNLSLTIGKKDSEATILNNINFTLGPSEILSIVGPSGSGKSMIVKMLSRLTENLVLFNLSGNIELEKEGVKQNIFQFNNQQLSTYRNEEIGIVFQQSKAILNPSKTIKKQISEKLITKNKYSGTELEDILSELIIEVGLEDPQRMLTSYPHQLSGGQLQRVLIALALANNPQFILADEPVSALDANLKAELLELLLKINRTRQISILLISHNIEIVSKVSDRILILNEGEILEEGSVDQIINQPHNAFTKALISCNLPEDSNVYRLPLLDDYLDNPDLTKKAFYQSNLIPDEYIKERSASFENSEILIEARSLSKSYLNENSIFSSAKEKFNVFEELNFNIRKGEVFGLVGDSGSGKSTLARILALLELPDDGEFIINGQDIRSRSENEIKRLQSKYQIIFQDPLFSMPPHYSVKELLSEVLDSQEDSNTLMIKALKRVGLERQFLEKVPRMMSGGERQRVLIARSLLLNPDLLICDEVLSALDVSSQAQVINLILELNRQDDLTVVFISHDLKVVKFVSDRVLELNPLILTTSSNI